MLENAPSSVDYLGDGLVAAFPVPFPFADAEDIRVSVDGAPVWLGAGLAVDGAGKVNGVHAGGTATLSPAPAAGAEVKVWRDTDRRQDTSLAQYGNAYLAAAERGLDRAVMMAQELHGRLNAAEEGLADSGDGVSLLGQELADHAASAAAHGIPGQAAVAVALHDADHAAHGGLAAEVAGKITAAQAQSIVDTALAGLDPGGGSGSNPNLLINTDFRSPIDQRGALGQALGASMTYCVDRWTGRNGAVTQEPGAARLAASGTAICDLIQRVEGPERFRGRTVTLSAKARANVPCVLLAWDRVTSNNVPIPGDGQWHVLTDTIAVDAGATDLWAVIRLGAHGAGDWLEIDWAKLEEGQVVSPWLVPDRAVELGRCHRYCRALGSGGGDAPIGVTSIYSATEARTVVSVPGMRAAPTLKWTGAFDVGGFAVTDIQRGDYGNGQCLLRAMTAGGMTPGGCGCLLARAGANIILDSEIN